MSDIANIDGLSEVPFEKNSKHEKQYCNLQDCIMTLPFFLLFIGDFQLPVGDSVVTIPMGMALIFPVFFWYLIIGRIRFSGVSLLLIGILLSGLLGLLFTEQASFLRSVAGALPIVFAVTTIIVYEQYHISYDKAIKYMLWGGGVLALAVMILFILSLGASGDYYDQKLIIETPLGRSNYLAAFLLFLFALSLPRNSFFSTIFIIAIFCTLSRGGVLALIIFLAIILFSKYKKLLFLGLLLLLSCLLAIFLAPGAFVNYASGIFNFQDRELDSVFNRFELWSFGFDLFSEHPIFGIGPNTFRTFVELAGDIENVWGVHNSVLLMLLNYGIFGLIFYLLYVAIIYNDIILAAQVKKSFFHLRAAFLVLLIFGLYEPLVGSAAFEMLLAFIFILSRSRVRLTSSQ